MSDHGETAAEQRKWQCVQCTYLNFQQATKCTICKRVRRIEDELVVAVRVCKRVALGRVQTEAQLSKQRSPPPSTSAVDVNAAQKWQCAVCTYQNYPKSQRCTVCRADRPGNVGGDDQLGPSTSSAVNLQALVRCFAVYIINAHTGLVVDA
jgi:ubiquitin thioesterase ZRANB1